MYADAPFRKSDKSPLHSPKLTGLAYLLALPFWICQLFVGWPGNPTDEETPQAIISCDYTSEVMSSAERGGMVFYSRIFRLTRPAMLMSPVPR